MEKGWEATGLLKPLWARVGGRDALAELAGISPPGTLSAYNSGKRPLGIVNARKIAAALDISLLELGAPEEVLDPKDQGVLARLASLEASAVREADLDPWLNVVELLAEGRVREAKEAVAEIRR